MENELLSLPGTLPRFHRPIPARSLVQMNEKVVAKQLSQNYFPQNNLQGSSLVLMGLLKEETKRKEKV